MSVVGGGGVEGNPRSRFTHTHTHVCMHVHAYTHLFLDRARKSASIYIAECRSHTYMIYAVDNAVLICIQIYVYTDTIICIYIYIVYTLPFSSILDMHM